MILNGVRQCGKTYVLKEFGRQEFDSLAYVSCDRNVNLQAIYSGDFDVARIIQGLSALTGVDIIPGKTLIFLDEVQAFPQALEALKYFCEDAPEYHIVVAGSLLGVCFTCRSLVSCRQGADFASLSDGFRGIPHGDGRGAVAEADAQP